MRGIKSGNIVKNECVLDFAKNQKKIIFNLNNCWFC